MQIVAFEVAGGHRNGPTSTPQGSQFTAPGASCDVSGCTVTVCASCTTSQDWVDPSLTQGFNSTLLGQFSLFNPSFYEEAVVTKPLAWVVNRGLKLVGVPASVVAQIFKVGGLAVIPLYEAGTAAGAVNLFFNGGFGVPGAVDNLPVNLPGSYGSGVSMGGGVYWQEDFPQ